MRFSSGFLSTRYMFQSSELPRGAFSSKITLRMISNVDFEMDQTVQTIITAMNYGPDWQTYLWGRDLSDVGARCDRCL